MSFCRNCGKEVLEQAVACMSCGLAPTNGNKFCRTCGAETNPEAVICVKCGVAVGNPRITKGGSSAQANPDSKIIFPIDPPKNPILMAVLSVLLVGLGQILLGQTAKGITILVGTIGFGILILQR